MSHFYGTLKGARGRATRCGHKSSGLVTQAASWSGAVEVELRHDEATGKDRYTVRQMPWHGRGVGEVLAEGVVGERSASDAPARKELEAVDAG